MAKWDVEVNQSYSCGEDEAREKVKKMLVDFQARNASIVKGIRWRDDHTAIAEGRGFDAEFLVGGGTAKAQVKLGLAAKLMRGKVESGLKKALTDAFA